MITKYIIRTAGIVLILLLIGFVVVVGQLYANGKQVYEDRTVQVVEMMELHPDLFNQIFNQIMPNALACYPQTTDCRHTVRNEIENVLSNTENSRAAVTLDQPMYFIKLQENSISKLFFSGHIKIDPIDTLSEKQVRDVLVGKRKTLFGLQANIDGLRMTYLNDLYSEAEVVVPYLVNGEIVGAVVYLHGD